MIQFIAEGWPLFLATALIFAGIGLVAGFAVARIGREKRKKEVLQTLESAKHLIGFDRDATKDSIDELYSLLKEANKHAYSAEVAGSSASAAAEKAMKKADGIKEALSVFVIDDDITPAHIDNAIELVKKMPDIDPGNRP